MYPVSRFWNFGWRLYYFCSWKSKPRKEKEIFCIFNILNWGTLGSVTSENSCFFLSSALHLKRKFQLSFTLFVEDYVKHSWEYKVSVRSDSVHNNHIAKVIKKQLWNGKSLWKYWVHSGRVFSVSGQREGGKNWEP